MNLLGVEGINNYFETLVVKHSLHNHRLNPNISMLFSFQLVTQDKIIDIICSIKLNAIGIDDLLLLMPFVESEVITIN